MIEMQTSVREHLGSRSSKRLIEDGLVPAVLYKKGSESMHIALSMKEMIKVLHSGSSTSTIIKLNLGGKAQEAVIKAIQLDPVKDTPIHVELSAVASGEAKVFQVPVVFSNREKSPGIKRGGFFNILSRKLLIECTPENLPDKISFDCSSVTIGQKISAGQVPLADGLSLAMDPKRIIASIIGRGKAAAAAQAEAA